MYTVTDNTKRLKDNTVLERTCQHRGFTAEAGSKCMSTSSDENTLRNSKKYLAAM